MERLAIRLMDSASAEVRAGRCVHRFKFVVWDHLHNAKADCNALCPMGDPKYALAEPVVTPRTDDANAVAEVARHAFPLGALTVERWSLRKFASAMPSSRFAEFLATFETPIVQTLNSVSLIPLLRRLPLIVQRRQG